MGSAARFLESIGYLSRDGGGRLALSEMGLQSVREGKRYTRALEDRRHLYFDGFTCRPLTRPFYDDRAVTFLDGAGLAQLVAEMGMGSGQAAVRGSFTPVIPIPPMGLGPQALSSLAQLSASERDRFNRWRRWPGAAADRGVHQDARLVLPGMVRRRATPSPRAARSRRLLPRSTRQDRPRRGGQAGRFGRQGVSARCPQPRSRSSPGTRAGRP